MYFLKSAPVLDERPHSIGREPSCFGKHGANFLAGSFYSGGLSTAQQNKVSITVDRHSGNLLAGIHKSVLDTG